MPTINPGREFYPMPAFPTLEVKDLEQSMRWYENVLGFRNIFMMPGTGNKPVIVHLRRARYADPLLRSETDNTQPIKIKAWVCTSLFALLITTLTTSPRKRRTKVQKSSLDRKINREMHESLQSQIPMDFASHSHRDLWSKIAA